MRSAHAEHRRKRLLSVHVLLYVFHLETVDKESQETGIGEGIRFGGVEVHCAPLRVVGKVRLLSGTGRVILTKERAVRKMNLEVSLVRSEKEKANFGLTVMWGKPKLASQKCFP
jgi:hypothetical protein